MLYWQPQPLCGKHLPDTRPHARCSKVLSIETSAFSVLFEWPCRWWPSLPAVLSDSSPCDCSAGTGSSPYCNLAVRSFNLCIIGLRSPCNDAAACRSDIMESRKASSAACRVMLDLILTTSRVHSRPSRRHRAQGSNLSHFNFFLEHSSNSQPGTIWTLSGQNTLTGTGSPLRHTNVLVGHLNDIQAESWLEITFPEESIPTERAAWRLLAVVCKDRFLSLSLKAR